MYNSLNLRQRQRDMLKIAHENLALFQRLQMKEPHYNHMKWVCTYDQMYVVFNMSCAVGVFVISELYF